MGKKISLEERIIQAREVHGDKYDYSLITEYKNDRTKYPIICPEHGIFYKSFNKHIKGKQGCPKCSGKFRYNTNTFIDKAKVLEHCKNYTFEKVDFVSTKQNVTITCHEKDENGKEHGDFEITPSHLFAGQGCPICRYIKSANSKRRPIKKIIELAREVHGDKYDYSLITEYKNDRTKYRIICPEHGVFEQTMNNHIKGKQGCPKCARITTANKTRYTKEEYINKVKEVHNNQYDYSKTEYIDVNSSICIICPKHGEFWQDAGNHLYLKQGCPKCANIVSMPEKEILKYLKSILPENTVIEENVRGIINKNELDIYIPKYKIAFEFDGLYWHNEINKEKNYHLNKTIVCEKNGIRLIHIFEDEWLYKQDIVKSMLKNVLGKTSERVYARKCEIKEVKTKEASDFLINNHLQGKCGSSVKIGLYYNNELLSLMCFGKSRHFIGNGKTQWELLRFCNKLNTNVIGGASKLLNYFITTYNPEEIVSYADRRWSKGNLYEKLGFTKYNESKPNYYYIIGNNRIYRFNLRKQILIKKYNCPENMSEHEFCLSKKWYRIYDCGCLCYIWKKEKCS